VDSVDNVVTRRIYRAVRRTARRARRVYYSHGLSRLSAGVHARYDLASSVTIVASKRTGSTWVQELMSGGAGVCPIFEPLESDPRARELSRGAEDVLLPGEVVADLEAFLTRAMRGAHVTRWSMKLSSHSRLLTADRFVVKHVQLCRAAGWLATTFPDTPMVLVVRHPCAVVQSMLTVPWSGTNATEILAKRPAAATRRAIEILDGRDAPAEVFAALWASEMQAMLGETDVESTPLIAYESVVDDPAGALGPVMEQLRLPRPPDLVARSNRPSATTHRSSVVRASGDRLTGWLDRLDPADQAAVLAVVRDAGITGYGRDPRPDLEALAELHARPTITSA
jgi:hypothetical protein